MTAVLLIVRSHTRNNPTVHFRSSLSLMFESLYSYYYFSEYCRFPEFISHSNGIKVIQVSTRSLPALFLALKIDERRRGRGGRACWMPNNEPQVCIVFVEQFIFAHCRHHFQVALFSTFGVATAIAFVYKVRKYGTEGGKWILMFSFCDAFIWVLIGSFDIAIVQKHIALENASLKARLSYQHTESKRYMIRSV